MTVQELWSLLNLYKSAFSGEQIDDAIGVIINGGIEAAVEEASRAASAANASAESAAKSATDLGVAVSNAGSSARLSDSSAKTSESYAVGGTGTREGEDEDNAKFYSDQAKAQAKALFTAEIDGRGHLVYTKPDGTKYDLGNVTGASVTHRWNGTTLEVTSASGTSSADLEGPPGATGVYIGSDTPPEHANVWVNPEGDPTGTDDWEFDMLDGTTEEKTVVVIGAEDGSGRLGILRVRNADGTWTDIPAIVGAKGDDYTLTAGDKNEIAEQVLGMVAYVQPNTPPDDAPENSLWIDTDEDMVSEPLSGVMASIDNGISVIDTGLTYTRGIVEVRRMGDILWIIDSGVYNFTANFAAANNRTVLEFSLPKDLSSKLPNVNGVYGTTGTIGYFPALAYENVTYTTFNCQSYLKRSAVGDDKDTFQLVYTGLSAISGGGLCGFHLKMPLILVDKEA